MMYGRGLVTGDATSTPRGRYRYVPVSCICRCTCTCPMMPIATRTSETLMARVLCHAHAHAHADADRGAMRMHLQRCLSIMISSFVGTALPWCRVVRMPGLQNLAPLRYKRPGGLQNRRPRTATKSLRKRYEGPGVWLAYIYIYILRGALPLFVSHNCPLFPNLCTSSALSNL